MVLMGRLEAHLIKLSSEPVRSIWICAGISLQRRTIAAVFLT
jgi:hypothetical protein